MRKRILFLLSAILLLSLAACGMHPAAEPQPEAQPEQQELPAPAPDPESEPKPEPEPEPEPEPKPEPAGINLLTGLPIEPEYENNRPVAVMFNNLRAALPQLGVSQADIIYEVPAEGGITRMLGVYQTLEGVGNLGSIRSVRPYYLELALGHDALLVHAGGSPEAYQDIAAWGVNNMDGVNGGSDARIFWRDAARRKNAGYEHSLLTSGENVQNYLAKGRYRLTHRDGYQYPVVFSDDGTPTGGTAAERITLRYTQYKTGIFDYDAETKRYLVSEYGQAYKDGNTGEQIGVTNVLILETDIHAIAGDSAGRIRVRTTGTGSGTYFCGGQSVRIQWSKADRSSPFVYTLSDGTPLSLGKGTSYVCLISTKTSSLTVE